MVDFLFIIIELFCYLLRLRHYKQKSVEVGAFRRGVGHFERKFQTEGASPTNQCWCQNSRVIALSCGIKISTVHHLVLSQCTRMTDRQNYDSQDHTNIAAHMVKACPRKEIPSLVVHLLRLMGRKQSRNYSYKPGAHMELYDCTDTQMLP